MIFSVKNHASVVMFDEIAQISKGGPFTVEKDTIFKGDVDLCLRPFVDKADVGDRYFLVTCTLRNGESISKAVFTEAFVMNDDGKTIEVIRP